MIPVPRFLQEHQREIRILVPEDQSIYYDKWRWEEWLKGDRDFSYIVEAYPRSITRADLAAMSHAAHRLGDDELNRRLFLASMMWGYGDGDNRGPWRVSRMLRSLDSGDVLRRSLSLISAGKTVEAYRRFDVQQCGPVFRTKYFYFVGLGCDVQVKPLVLDSKVAGQLGSVLGRREMSRFGVAEDSQGRAVVGYSPQGYWKYVRMMTEWAHELKCRPDSIELFLFQSAKMESDNSACHE